MKNQEISEKSKEMILRFVIKDIASHVLIQDLYTLDLLTLLVGQVIQFPSPQQIKGGHWYLQLEN